MNAIQTTMQYDVVANNIVEGRLSETPTIIRKDFSAPMSEGEKAFFDEMEKGFDARLFTFEDAIQRGLYDSEDAETGKTIPGSFLSVTEEDTKIALINPIINSLFAEHSVLTEYNMGDYKIDMGITSSNSNSGSLDKEVKVEAKRIMYKMRNDGVICTTKSQLEETFFKHGKKPGLKGNDDSMRLTGVAGSQIIRMNANGQDTLSSEGIAIYTNGLIYAVSVTYNDTFTDKEIREFSRDIKVLKDIAKENDGNVYTGAFSRSDYPMFVFTIKEYNEDTDKYELNVADLITFRNMLYSFIHNTKSWRTFKIDVHNWYIDELRTYLNKSE